MFTIQIRFLYIKVIRNWETLFPKKLFISKICQQGKLNNTYREFGKSLSPKIERLEKQGEGLKLWVFCLFEQRSSGPNS